MHLHPSIIPLAARSRLAARATDAKICLWQIKHRRVQTAAVGLCRGVYVFIGWVQLCPSSGLCSGVCRQPQWVNVGVFMYSLAGWCILFPADYAPAWADSCSGFMAGCLCIHWPGGSFGLPAVYAPACADSRSGLMSGCLCIHWPGAALSFQRFMLRRVQTAAVGLCRGVYVFIGWVQPVLRSELYLIIHAEMPLRLFMDFSAGSLCISKQNATISQAELYPILHARHYPSHNPELPSRAL